MLVCVIGNFDPEDPGHSTIEPSLRRAAGPGSTIGEVRWIAPETLVEAHVDTGRVTAGTLTVNATLPPGVRDSFLSGEWNPTAMLLDKFDEVRKVSTRLPYAPTA